VFEGERCIGISALYCDLEGNHGELIMMWVEPNHRGSSAGTVLVQKLLSWAKEIGMDFVELGVTRKNTGVVTFYEKQGFLVIKEDTFIDVEQKLCDIRMRIDLK